MRIVCDLHSVNFINYLRQCRTACLTPEDPRYERRPSANAPRPIVLRLVLASHFIRRRARPTTVAAQGLDLRLQRLVLGDFARQEGPRQSSLLGDPARRQDVGVAQLVV